VTTWPRTTLRPTSSCFRARRRRSGTSRSKRWRAAWRWSPTTMRPRGSTRSTASRPCWYGRATHAASSTPPWRSRRRPMC
jgi:hypothetical protein